MRVLTLFLFLLVGCAGGRPDVQGYRGIWFSLGQFTEYGDKYSGGLGTYTAKHHPLAVYSEEAGKTFFVYGGTRSEAADTQLLAMIGYYDHENDEVGRPVIVYEKEGVNDPHDNPSLSVDEEGYIWVFVSGRGSIRPGVILKSRHPYEISSFEQVLVDEFAYPQPWSLSAGGFVLLFTRYTDGRELYWRTSDDGHSWNPPQKLVSGGHYQMSNEQHGVIITAYNTHYPNRRVDARSNLYFLRTYDQGESWETASGQILETPIDSTDRRPLVRDYRAEGRLVYLKDIGFDKEGNPVLLYITSADYRSGPSGYPRTWTLAHWKNEEWVFHELMPATHNYDMGSLYIEEDAWRLVAPTTPGPQYWGTGGEMALWESRDEGANWIRIKSLTEGSEFNHAYARRPRHAHPDFYAFWADGNPDSLSRSQLYMMSRSGSVKRLPYRFRGRKARPIPIKQEN